MKTATWEKQCDEWQAIGDEMLAAGKTPVMHDITSEQHKRMRERGERPLTYGEILEELS